MHTNRLTCIHVRAGIGKLKIFLQILAYEDIRKILLFRDEQLF